MLRSGPSAVSLPCALACLGSSSTTSTSKPTATATTTAITSGPMTLDSPNAYNAVDQRLVLLPLESRVSRGVVFVLTLVVAGWLAVQPARPAIAWYDGRGDKIPGLERAIAWDPQNADLHIRLGHAYADRVPADIDRARAQYAEAIRLRPTDAYPRLLQALLSEKQGDRAAARSASDGAVRLDPPNGALRWEAALLARGWGGGAAGPAPCPDVLGV